MARSDPTQPIRYVHNIRHKSSSSFFMVRSTALTAKSGKCQKHYVFTNVLETFADPRRHKGHMISCWACVVIITFHHPPLCPLCPVSCGTNKGSRRGIHTPWLTLTCRFPMEINLRLKSVELICSLRKLCRPQTFKNSLTHSLTLILSAGLPSSPVGSSSWTRAGSTTWASTTPTWTSGEGRTSVSSLMMMMNCHLNQNNDFLIHPPPQTSYTQYP